jgi:hypothetical protein
LFMGQHPLQLSLEQLKSYAVFNVRHSSDTAC